jgi:hypothetical protein
VKIRCLRDIYTSLNDISQSIYSTYGVSILGIVVWFFTYSIACVVFTLRHISNGGYPVAIIMLFFVSLSLLAAITIPCHLTTDEATRSSVLILKLLLRTDINERIMKDLDRFYTQVNSMGVNSQLVDSSRWMCHCFVVYLEQSVLI